MENTFQYPPDLFNLLVQAIPRLCKSKKEVLLFFQGAGVSQDLAADLSRRVSSDPKSITKYEIAQTILKKINEQGDLSLRERREVLKRVTEYEDFSSCWPEDRLEAKGLVAEIRRVVGIKDSFTRIKQERDQERKLRQDEYTAKVNKIQKRALEVQEVRKDLFALFSEANPWIRGKRLEAVLNRLFRMDGMLVRESFTLCGNEREGIVEQIDGVIDLDGQLYLVEMKWEKQRLGTPEVSALLVKVFNRGEARGIIISASGYTDAAVKVCKDSLTKMVVVLTDLKEFVRLLDDERDLRVFLKAKIQAAIIDKNPLFEPSAAG